MIDSISNLDKLDKVAVYYIVLQMDFTVMCYF